MTAFAPGDPCLLYDTKGRQYLIDLQPGVEFHYHRGVLPHDTIIGSEDGTVHESTLGARLVALRPRLARVPFLRRLENNPPGLADRIRC